MGEITYLGLQLLHINKRVPWKMWDVKGGCNELLMLQFRQFDGKYDNHLPTTSRTKSGIHILVVLKVSSK